MGREHSTAIFNCPAFHLLRTDVPNPESVAMTTALSASLASTLVARFLRSNNYTHTLDAFIREAGLPADAGQITAKDDSDENSWTIEGILEEKKKYDKSISFERYGDGGKENVKWSTPGE